jgi:hypothetical protein
MVAFQSLQFSAKGNQSEIEHQQIQQQKYI